MKDIYVKRNFNINISFIKKTGLKPVFFKYLFRVKSPFDNFFQLFTAGGSHQNHAQRT